MTTTNSNVAEHIQPNSQDTQDALFVIKRDGTLAPYKNDKITVAITKAILAAEGHESSDARHVKQLSNQIVEGISNRFHKMYPSGGSINIEDIKQLKWRVTIFCILPFR